MKNLITPKKLECTLDNPLSPTLVTLHLPELELENSCEKEGFTFKSTDKINVEIRKTDDHRINSIEKEKIQLAPVTDSQLNLELEDLELGLKFSVGFTDQGDVQKVSAQWSLVS